MMLGREISGWQERALKAEAECDMLRGILLILSGWDGKKESARECYVSAIEAAKASGVAA
jgi:hypothetical protein